jgi:hypothetical protein
MNWRFFGIVLVRSHAERAAGNAYHAVDYEDCFCARVSFTVYSASHKENYLRASERVELDCGPTRGTQF